MIDLSLDESHYLLNLLDDRINPLAAGLVTKIESSFRGIPLQDAYRRTARGLHEVEGEVEIDEHADVHRGSDAGAYVNAWVWVPEEELVIEWKDVLDSIIETAGKAGYRGTGYLYILVENSEGDAFVHKFPNVPRLDAPPGLLDQISLSTQEGGVRVSIFCCSVPLTPGNENPAFDWIETLFILGNFEYSPTFQDTPDPLRKIHYASNA